MPTAGFKPAISASERPQTHAIGRAATMMVDLHWYRVFAKDSSKGLQTRRRTSLDPTLRDFRHKIWGYYCEI